MRIVYRYYFFTNKLTIKYKVSTLNASLFKGIFFSFIFLMFGCQKEGNLLTDERSLALNSRELKSVSKANPSQADKAFDKELQQIMTQMMQAMNQMEMTCDPDIDFARMMIMHHEAGIEVAEAELQYGHEPEAKELAQKTIVGNQASKERLEAFLAAHPSPEPLSKELCRQYMKEMDKAMRRMMQCMRKADTEDVDVDFAAQMICHHEGAIAMSRTELKYGDDAAAQEEARLIIQEQSQEIIALSQFINDHGMGTKKN